MNTPTPKIGDKWFRYEDRPYSSGIDEFGDLLGPPTLRINLVEFAVVKVTPKGVQLVRIYGDFKDTHTRFVLLGARKKYACPNEQSARISFLARKSRQAGIYRARLKRAEEAISKMERADLTGMMLGKTSAFMQ